MISKNWNSLCVCTLAVMRGFSFFSNWALSSLALDNAWQASTMLSGFWRERYFFSALGQDCLETNHNLSSVKLLLGLGQPLLQPLQFCSSVSLNNGNDWWMVGGQEDIWYQDIWFGGVFDAWIFCVGIFDINRVDKLQSTFHMPRHFNSTHSFCRI